MPYSLGIPMQIPKEHVLMPTYGDGVLRVKHTVTEVTALPCIKHETLLSWKTQNCILDICELINCTHSTTSAGLTKFPFDTFFLCTHKLPGHIKIIIVARPTRRLHIALTFAGGSEAQVSSFFSSFLALLFEKLQM